MGVRNGGCSGGETFTNVLLPLWCVLQGNWLKKPLRGDLKYVLVLPHLQEVRGCHCEPAGVPAVAGSTSPSLCT